jgi:putative ABC transport system substrate-binding protein
VNPRRRELLHGSLAVAGLGLLAGCGRLPFPGRQPAKVPLIGYLGGSASPLLLEAFRQGLREHGWVEGQSVALEARFADGQIERLPELAEELLRLPVDLFVTAGANSTLAAHSASSTLPIVQATGSGDLIAEGLVRSFAQPGGNVTGLTELLPELAGKRLELLTEAVPGAVRLVGLWAAAQTNSVEMAAAQSAAQELGLELRPLSARSPEELRAVFDWAISNRADAVLVVTDSFTLTQRTTIAELALQSRLPSMFDRREYLEPGGLLSYGTNIPDLPRRAATYVDKILKGAKPADLPIERPTKFDFIINLKTATALGRTIPQSVLAQATELIE